MKIIFRFNSQSRDKDVPDAFEIAKKKNGKLIGSVYQVEFSSSQDKDLMKLYVLVGHLDDSTLIINDEEFQPSVIYCIFNCPMKLNCSGKCVYRDEHHKLSAKKFCEKFKSFRDNEDYDFYVQI